MWGPAVAGTVETGETYETNIYKEAEEEIGLTGIKFMVGPKLRVTNPRNYFCQWFTVTLERPANEFILQEEEVEAIKWIGRVELVEDVAHYPEGYIPTMSSVLEILDIS